MWVSPTVLATAPLRPCAGVCTPLTNRSVARTQFNFSYFRNHFGDRVVDAYPHNMAFETVRPILMTMTDALAEATAPSGVYPTKYVCPPPPSITPPSDASPDCLC